MPAMLSMNQQKPYLTLSDVQIRMEDVLYSHESEHQLEVRNPRVIHVDGLDKAIHTPSQTFDRIYDLRHISARICSVNEEVALYHPQCVSQTMPRV